ncbi:MAG: RNA polymerase sigma factor [Planctomycetota bacterium]
MSERHNQLSDNDLILAAGSGDREAFAILVERHYRAVIQFVHRFLGSTDQNLAEDIAQETFLGAWKSAPSFRPQAKVLTWLMRITINRCLSYRRSSRLRKTAALNGNGIADPIEPSATPDALAMNYEQAQQVRDAVLDLPSKQHTAVILRYFYGFSYSDIAQVLGISVSAVESVLFRAREKLRGQLRGTKN